MRARIGKLPSIVVCVVFGAVLLGCAPQPKDSEITGAEAIAAQYGLHFAGEPSVSAAQLPQDLTKPPWGVLVSEAEDAGYDLGPYAGSTLTLSSYPLEETQDGLALTLHVFDDHGEVVGAYVSLTADNPVYQPIPGVLSLDEVEAD